VRRSAFTLMELMISVVLIALITLFMYAAIGTTKRSNDTLKRHSQNEHNRTMIYDLLYRDLFQAISIETIQPVNKHYTVVQLQTINTIYDLIYPYVTYYVHNEKKRLIRLESARKINLPLSYDAKIGTYANVLISDVEDFNLYKSQKITPPPSINDPDSLSSNEPLDGNTSIVKEVDESVLLYLNAKSMSQPMVIELFVGNASESNRSKR